MATGDPPPWGYPYIGNPVLPTYTFYPAPQHIDYAPPLAWQPSWIGAAQSTFGTPRLSDEDVERIARRVEEMRLARDANLGELRAATIAAMSAAARHGAAAARAMAERLRLWARRGER